jgi:uncharacterized protein YjbI with pentapeptide repeats
MNDERLAPRAGTIPAKDNRKRTITRADIINWLNRGETDFTEVQAPGVDFSRLDLRGCDFTGANLARAKFVQTDLRGASLRGANLMQAAFTYASLDDCDLAGATWAGARFVEVTAARTVLEQAASQAESSEAIARRTVDGLKYKRP